MPIVDLTIQQARALRLFIRSLDRDSIPTAYRLLLEEIYDLLR